MGWVGVMVDEFPLMRMMSWPLHFVLVNFFTTSFIDILNPQSVLFTLFRSSGVIPIPTSLPLIQAGTMQPGPPPHCTTV